MDLVTIALTLLIISYIGMSIIDPIISELKKPKRISPFAAVMFLLLAWFCVLVCVMPNFINSILRFISH